ncbi:MAG: hypothetical protein ISR96_12040 [Nitrospira sp.]|nr:hypothetical protein [Nitrospira sp.]
MISKDSRQEILDLAGSDSLREDMRFIAENRHNPVMEKGEVNLDRLLEFLNGYNEFISHKPKTFKRMLEKVMKL